MQAHDAASAISIFEQTVDQPEESRLAWLHAHHGDNPSLLAQVKRMLEADAAVDRMLPTEGFSFAKPMLPPPERVGRYRLVHLLGEGGMGQVFLGERDDGLFEHKAAIKLLRPVALLDIAVRQFESERRLLARLTHRHIAQLFDGGVTEQGAPYLIMEFVKGEAIDDYVRRKEATTRQVVELMIPVCDAIQHAHQNLIVHADIKTSNILVTEAGDPKIVDFGVSALVAAPGAMSDGRPLGWTPGYCCPERIGGAPPSPSEDVFSLGIVLKVLLTGSQPDAHGWAGPADTLVDKAFADRPESWRRERKQQLGGDLGRIVTRATAPARSGRYPSVEALRQDLQAWLAHRPIASMRANRMHAFRLFYRRNTLRVILASLLLTTVLAALLVSTLLYLRAESERAAAERRYGEVRELAGFMMFDLYDELVRTTGNTRALELITDKSLGYLQSLRDDPNAPIEVALEAAAGYRRMADVLGNPTGPNLGERATATHMLDEAVAQLEALNRRLPGNRNAMENLGEAVFSSATNAFVSENNEEKARRLALRAAEVYGALSTRADATVDDKRNLLRSRLMAAVPLAGLGQAATGVSELGVVRDQAAALAAQYPDNPAVEQFLGSINVELARAIIRHRSAGGPAVDTLAFWDEAVRIREAGYARDPSDIRPYRTLATILYERGAERRYAEKYDLALEDMSRAGAIIDELMANDPDNQGLKRTAGGIVDETAKTLAYAGRVGEAVAMIPRALQISEDQFAAAKDSRGMAREFAYSLTLYADVYRKAGQRRQACNMTERARSSWTAASEGEPLSATDRDFVRESFAELDLFCK